MNKFLADKVLSEPKTRITFRALRRQKGCNLIITAMDINGDVVQLSADTFPDMPVADAVLATCAVQPYIARVLYKDGNKMEHKLYSCSPKETLPVYIARERFIEGMRSGKYTGVFSAKVAIFGCKCANNELSSLSSKTDYYHLLTQKRQAARPPADCGRRTILF